ncbi:MAG: thioredoxin family protein [Acidobacteria bacterium]|jgi:thiol:disulfide interchange protein|nr:thioredoxin family protein [Acidobacteriota bacterium]
MRKFTISIAIILIGTLGVFAQTTKVKNGRSVKKSAAKKIKAQTADKVQTAQRLKFDPTRNPNDDLQAAILLAKKEHKRIILDVGGEWCGWCHEMDAFIERNRELKKLRDENYVWLKINFSEENENREFLAAYPQIKGYPHLYILEADGKFIFSKDTSELEDGVKSYNLKKFTDFLTQYAPRQNAGK